MPQTGFEPVHGNPYNDLNVARLPIPPLGQLIAINYLTTINSIQTLSPNYKTFPLILIQELDHCPITRQNEELRRYLHVGDICREADVHYTIGMLAVGPFL